VNGGAFAVSESLGDGRIHPYSELPPHDVGTGDGIASRTAAIARARARATFARGRGT
jgi:hypothetical protein